MARGTGDCRAAGSGARPLRPVAPRAASRRGRVVAAGQQPATALDHVTNVSDFIWGGTWAGQEVLPFPPMVIVLLGIGL